MTIARAHHGLLLRPSGGGGGPTDPDWGSVRLLLHFDGANGSTTFTDVRGHTFTPNNSADLSSAQARFGATSGRLDSTRYIISTATSDQGLASGPFCIEMWVYLNSISGLKSLWTTRHNGSVSTYAYINGSSILTSVSGWGSASGVLTAGAWHHLAFTRDGSNNLRMFVDGVVVDTSTGGPTHTGDVSWRLGFDAATVNQSFNGYMDDFRLTVGAARYTAGFTPPAAAFPDS